MQLKKNIKCLDKNSNKRYVKLCTENYKALLQDINEDLNQWVVQKELKLHQCEHLNFTQSNIVFFGRS